jgi:mono/diheme cytochrome c family protein
MKKVFIILLAAGLLYACSNGSNSNTTDTKDASATSATSGDNPSYDPHRGEGKFAKVEISDKLDATMADAGKKIYDVKCSACHKLTTEKLVGPGWSGVTKKFAPVWIMNFITNPDAMIDKDPALQAQLELCLVRMPNQNLTDEDARHIFEFMRQNDGVQ